LAWPDLAAHDWHSVGWTTVAGFLYIGMIAGVIAALMWYRAVRQIGPARTMVYANVEPIFVVGFAALLLGESIELTAIAGGLLVIAGVVLTRSPAAPPDAASEPALAPAGGVGQETSAA
jgi:drug/metabolite transporter (DMT)-like permease